MKSLYFIFSASFLLGIAPVFAQPTPTPIEFLFGNNRIQGQIISRKSFGEGPVGLFSLTNLAGDYGNTDASNNEVISNLHLTFQLTKHIRLAGGASFHSVKGFVPQAGLQFQISQKQLLLVVNPTVEFNHQIALGSIAILEYRPTLKKGLDLYTRLQALYVQNLSLHAHERSFVLSRLGLSFKQFTPGIGFNLDYYGPTKRFKQNTGVFLRYTFF